MRALLLTAAASFATSTAGLAAQPPAAAPAKPAAVTGVPAAPPLGRLFFSPAERAHLDLARTQKKVPAPPAVAEAEPEAPPEPRIVSYGGIVRRSDGKSMLWINNRLVEEKEALAGLNLKGRVRPDGSVTLQVPESGGSIDVKVGQSVELNSGRRAEGRKAPSPSGAPADEGHAAQGAPGSPAARPGAAEAGGKKTDPSGDTGLKMDLGRRASRPPEDERPAAR